MNMEAFKEKKLSIVTQNTFEMLSYNRKCTDMTPKFVKVRA